MTENFGEFTSHSSSNPPASHPPQPRSIAKIAEALAKAQATIEQPEKNKTVSVTTKTGQKYTFDYADYNAIVEAVRRPLSQNGICFTHLIEEASHGLLLVTRLIHSSGEYLESIYPLPRTSEPKDLGGAITYGKRYCLSAITGCVADDDTDGTDRPGEETQDFKSRQPSKTAPAPLPQQRQAPPAQKTEQQPAGVSASQLARLFAIASERGWSNEQVKLYMESRWKISSTRELTIERYDNLVEVIQAKTFPQACTDSVSRQSESSS